MTNASGLHPLLATRWSPARFDLEHQASDRDVQALLEAARWAPSAGNSQPWAFIATVRGDDLHRRLVPYLAGSSREWASSASILVANLCHVRVEDTEWDYSEFAQYDLGQAVAHMTLQAGAIGLGSRQFRAFDRDGIAAEFAVPGHWQVTTMTAFGRAASPRPERERRASTDVPWSVGD